MRTIATPLFDAEPGSSLATAEMLLRTPPPEVTIETAEAVAMRYFGRGGKARALAGERDRNFLIAEAGGGTSVLKFYNAAEDAPTRSLQHGAMRHVHEREPACPVPDIHPTLEGREELLFSTGGTEVAVAMISLLPGVNPQADDLQPRLRLDVGRVVGMLSHALEDYEHPSANRAILWNTMLVAELAPLTAMIDDPARRAAIDRWLEHFSRQVRLLTADLPHQIIHNDLSLSNILVDSGDRSRVVGVIDFGDIVRAPRINEFAIAASYFMTPQTDPIAAIADILIGAGRDLGFRREEIDLIPDLVRARLATRILLSEWRTRLFPANRTYIMRSNAAAWSLWKHLDEEPTEAQSLRLLSLVEGILA